MSKQPKEPTTVERHQYFKDLQEQVLRKQAELDKIKHQYKSEMKAWLGMCDGETASVLDLVALYLALDGKK